ncbi:hypothetical protein SLA2020_301790 [Shorea laevis]
MYHSSMMCKWQLIIPLSLVFESFLCPLFSPLQVPSREKCVGLGKDHTIFSLIDGLVKFEKLGPDKKKVSV